MKDAYPCGTQFRKNSEIPADEINPYWDGHLKGVDKAYVQGYDDCIEDNIGGFFDNLMVYEGELERAFDTKDIFRKVDDNVLSDERSADEFPEDERDGWTRETAILKTIKDCMLHYAEMNRDENITGIIENGDYGEEEQEASKRETASEENT